MSEQKIAIGDKVKIGDQIGEVIKIERLGRSTHYRVAFSEGMPKSYLCPPVKVVKVLSPLELVRCGKFDEPWKFDLLTEATRLSLAYEYDHLLSLSSTRTDLQYYQIQAVYQVMSAYKQRFLIADDVGLGKTIEAGMILKELAGRGRAKRVLIVVPAPLQYQWHREMQERFDENFIMYTSGYVNELRNSLPIDTNVWEANNKIITSIDYAKRDTVLPELERAKWDLIIFDEAHKLSVSKFGGKIDFSDRYKLGATICGNAENLLFLTATPHKGDKFAFYGIISLLDPYLFVDEDSVKPEKLYTIMIRRGKDDIRDIDGKPLFPRREVTTLPIEFTNEEMKLYNAVTEYVKNEYNRAAELKKRNVGFAMVILQKRIVSSIAAITSSLENRRQALYKKMLEFTKEKIVKKEEIEPEYEPFVREYEEFSKDPDSLTDEQRENIEKILETLSLAKTPEELQSEIRKVEELIKMAKSIKIDTKARHLMKVVDEILKADPKEKVLIFTEYKDTLDYLVGLLKGRGHKLTVIHGEMSMELRRSAEDDFNGTNVNILVATDAAGEGLNLHLGGCHITINYELPWNPNRIEQRMGRLHRYGQKRDVKVHNIFVKGTKEGDIFILLMRKLEIIKEVLGGRVFDILGVLLERIRPKGLQELIMDAVAENKPVKVCHEDIDRTINDVTKSFKQIEEKFLMSFHKFDLEPTLKVVKRSQTISVNDKDIENFVRCFFKHLNGKIENTKLKYVYRLYPPKDIVSQAVKEVYEGATFTKEVAKKYKPTEVNFVAFGHPLLESVITLSTSYTFGGKSTIKIVNLDDGNNGAIFNFVLRYEDSQGNALSEDFLTVFVDKEENTRIIDPRQVIDYEGSTVAQGIAEVKDISNISSKIDHFYQLALAKANKIAQTQLEIVKQRREREIKIKADDAKRYFEMKIAEENKRIKEFEIKRMMGVDMNVAIRAAKRRLNDLEEAREKRMSELEGERQIIYQSPQLLNIGVGICGKQKPPIRTSKGVTSSDEREEIGEEGVKLVMVFERKRGWEPQDVSKEFRGYDVESSKDKERKYIECKTFVGESPTIQLTDNEWEQAKRLKDKYWVYVIENLHNLSERRLYVIQDPTVNSEIIEEVKRIKIIIPKWKNKCSEFCKI